MSEAESTAHSIAEAAASAKPEDVLLAAAAAPPLDSLSREDVAEITSEAMRAHGGTIEKNSFAALAQKAAIANDPKSAQPQTIVPESAGGNAAAARAADFNTVSQALKGTPYDLDIITHDLMRELESAAARAHGGQGNTKDARFSVTCTIVLVMLAAVQSLLEPCVHSAVACVTRSTISPLTACSVPVQR
jgi:hypothetical protein